MRKIIRKISDVAFVVSWSYLIGFFIIMVTLPFIPYSDAIIKLGRQIFSEERLRLALLIGVITLAPKFSLRRFITISINQAVRDELSRIERERDATS